MSRSFALSLGDSFLLIVSLSLAVHKIYNKYEIEPGNVPATLLLLLGVPVLPCYFLILNSDSINLSVVLAYALFYCTLALSIVLYRVSPMHPLAKYPGPVSLKVSKFVGMYHASGGKQHTFFKSLHDKYGPFVRVGPNELSVAEVEAIPIIADMKKGPMWDSHDIPGTPRELTAVRDFESHNERRKLWNRAFTTTSLKDFQPIVGSQILELVEELGKRVSPRSDKEVSLDLALWMSNFTYDLAGNLIFGRGFGLMNSGGEGGTRGIVERHAESLSLVHHIPWITSLLHKLAAVPEGQRRFQELAAERYQTRKEQPIPRKDIFHFITDEEGLENVEVSQGQGVNDTLLAIVAGADTTTTALSGLFFHLLSNDAAFSRLKKEVDSEFPLAEGAPFDVARLVKMPYLNAVINEALRVQPSVATAIQRTPPEGSGGAVVTGRFISENTALYVPPYVLHRDPRYFSPDPDSFIPERWLDASSEKFTTNASAFIPFSSGFANCWKESSLDGNAHGCCNDGAKV